MQEHSVELKLGHPDDAFSPPGSNERHLRLMAGIEGLPFMLRTEIVQILVRRLPARRPDIIQASGLGQQVLTIGTPMLYSHYHGQK